MILQNLENETNSTKETSTLSEKDVQDKTKIRLKMKLI